MRSWPALAAVLAALAPAAASAHPHIWISQHVRIVAREGSLVAAELEWRFDPRSSEGEIAAIDEDRDGKISPQETERLVHDTMQALQEAGFMTWLNTGTRDLRPGKPSAFSVRIDDPASFTPPDWDRSAGDPPGRRGRDAKTGKTPVHEAHAPRNLVYVMRFELPRPSKVLSITTFDPEDYVRIEVDKASLPDRCKLGKHSTYKSEYVPGHPVFADRVSCRLP